MRLVRVIQCPECESDNPIDATYCCGCGCDLPEGENRFDCIVYLVDWEVEHSVLDYLDEETEL